MGATLMQTLLRQPSQSYADKTHDTSLYEQTQYLGRQGSKARSTTSRASSIRSVGSGTQTPTSTYSRRSSYSNATAPNGDWVDGNWQWSQYGGRRGLTGGAQSIHPSEVASQLGVPAKRRSYRSSQSDAGDYYDDTRSVRSSRSLQSVRSVSSRRSMSELGNAAHWSKDGVASTTGSKLSLGGGSKTSRRYSELPAAVSQSLSTAPPSRRYASPIVAPHLASQRQPLRRHDSPGSEAPSLASSLSSAPSSPPITPTTTDHRDFPVHNAVKKRSKKSASSTSSSRRDPVVMASVHEELEAAYEDGHQAPTGIMALRQDQLEHGNVTVTAAPVSSKTASQLDKFAESSPVMVEPSKLRKYYSVDEFFAVADPTAAAAKEATPSPPAQPVLAASGSSISSSDEAKTTVLNDRAAPQSSDDGEQSASSSVNGEQDDAVSGSVSVPRISLTRTESDQSAIGIKGDVPVPTTDDDQSTASAPARKKSARKSATPSTSAPVNEVASEIQVVASSSSASKSHKRSKSASVVGEDGDSSASTAADDNAQWLKRIRALGDPIEATPLNATAKKRSSSSSSLSQPHWTVQQYEQRHQQQQHAPPPRRPSSLGNLRRPRLELAPMPEMDEDEDAVSVNGGGSAKGQLSQPQRQLRPDVSQDSSRSASPSPSRANSLHSQADSGKKVRSGSLPPRRRTQSVDDSSMYSTDSLAPTVLIVPHAPRPGDLSQPIMPIVTQAPLATDMYTIPPPTAPLPFRIPTAADEGWRRPRAMSSTSDAPSARSDSAYSTMSMPTGTFRRPPKNPARNSIHAANRQSMTMSFGAGAAAALQLNESAALMSTLSVSATALVRAPAATSSSSGFGSLFRKIEPPLASSASVNARFDPARDLTFAAMAPRPKKAKSDEVMVQVVAVGLDRHDIEKAKDMAGKAEGFGFVPGRSFYGKVLETGVDVSKVKRGEMVFGTTPLKKSAALADVLIVNRDRVAAAPVNSDLSVEQMAILPSVGTTAFLAMARICRELPKGSKIFILNAHEGIGHLCVQLARFLRPSAANDLFVVAHCPVTVDRGAEICHEAGASHVITNDVLAALNGLHESEFDVVVDTVGSRRVYDAARRVLHHSGSYITTVGDSLGLSTTSTSNSAWKNSMRSLRRSFIKKDKKRVSFLHVSPEIDDRGLGSEMPPRDVLDQLRLAAEEGVVCPRVGQTYAFEESAKAFKEGQPLEGRVVRVMQL